MSTWDDVRADAAPEVPADTGPDGVTVAPWPDVLPEAMRDYVATVAAGVGCPPDYVGAAVLAVAAAALGGTVAVRLRDGWAETPTIWTAIVAPPGSAKTPAVQEVLRPVRAAEDVAWADWEAAHRDWRRDMRTYDRAARRKGDADPGDPPDEPQMHRLATDDATTEALTPLLAANPRGLLLARDELAGWMRSMDAYHTGRGADRQWWLSVWSGVSAAKDRVTTGYVRAPHPCVSVLGGMVPARVRDVTDGGDDGMADRVLWVWPDARPPATWTTTGIPAHIRGVWARAWATLRRYGADPVEITWTPMGGRVWAAHHDALVADMADPSTPDALRGPTSKLRAYAARLALVLQALDDATDGRQSLGPIEADAVDRAWTLTRYYLDHARRVYLHSPVAAEEVTDRDSAVLALVREAGPEGISRANIQTAIWVSGRTARRTLSSLVARGALVAVGEDRATDRRYRVPDAR